MMGVFQSIELRTSAVRRGLIAPPLPTLQALAAFAIGAAVLAIAALLSLASPAYAEPSEPAGEQREQSQAEREQKPRVSMSPEAPTTPADRSTPSDARAIRVGEDEPPLTRAAERERVERISPTRWLTHYGDVSIDRRD